MRGPIHVVAVISDTDNDNDGVDDLTSSCTTICTSTSSTSTSSSSMTRAVRFSADVTYFHTLNRTEYILRELQQCFYTIKEKKQQWLHQNKAVTRFEKGKPEANDQVHRGLEPLTDKGYRILQQIKNKCVDAVMDVQEEQWRSGIVDWEQLAEASQQISKASTVIAIKLAKRDKQQANKAYLQMNRQSHQLAAASTASPSNIVDVDTLSVVSSLTDERSTLSTGMMAGNKYNTHPYSHHRHHHHHRKRNPTTTTTTTTTNTTTTNTTTDLMRSE
jgi:predicted secreted protein